MVRGPSCREDGGAEVGAGAELRDELSDDGADVRPLRHLGHAARHVEDEVEVRDVRIDRHGRLLAGPAGVVAGIRGFATVEARNQEAGPRAAGDRRKGEGDAR